MSVPRRRSGNHQALNPGQSAGSARSRALQAGVNWIVPIGAVEAVCNEREIIRPGALDSGPRYPPRGRSVKVENDLSGDSSW